MVRIVFLRTCFWSAKHSQRLAANTLPHLSRVGLVQHVTSGILVGVAVSCLVQDGLEHVYFVIDCGSGSLLLLQQLAGLKLVGVLAKSLCGRRCQSSSMCFRAEVRTARIASMSTLCKNSL